MGAIDPTRAQFEFFKSQPRDQPIQMLNLVRVRQKAAYPQDHPQAGSGLSGLEAYRLYARDSAPIFAEVGGRQLWIAEPQGVLIGPADERWDIAFIAEYPTASAFLAMITHPSYRDAVKHRQAAVEDSRLIRTGSLIPGAAFGQTKT
jgi:uncharacterized protein (DUF1330 family)